MLHHETGSPIGLLIRKVHPVNSKNTKKKTTKKTTKKTGKRTQLKATTWRSVLSKGAAFVKARNATQSATQAEVAAIEAASKANAKQESAEVAFAIVFFGYVSSNDITAKQAWLDVPGLAEGSTKAKKEANAKAQASTYMKAGRAYSLANASQRDMLPATLKSACRITEIATTVAKDNAGKDEDGNPIYSPQATLPEELTNKSTKKMTAEYCQQVKLDNSNAKKSKNGKTSSDAQLVSRMEKKVRGHSRVDEEAEKRRIAAELRKAYEDLAYDVDGSPDDRAMESLGLFNMALHDGAAITESMRMMIHSLIEEYGIEKPTRKMWSDKGNELTMSAHEEITEGRQAS